MSSARLWDVALWQWIGLVVAALVAIALGNLIAAMTTAISKRLSARTTTKWDDRFAELLRGPEAFFLAVLIAWALLEPLDLPEDAQHAANRTLQMVLIGAVAWFAIRLVRLSAEAIVDRAAAAAEADGQDLKLRGVRTQVAVLRRVASIVIGVIAISLMLVQFEVVRSVGVSLLASAGIAGIVIGLAAQKSIATLLAGIQLSITQPIRIGDTVLVENEYGWIEEITLTYVVVRIWDLRRLVVPMTRFLDQPFQNWTKVSPELLGTVFVHADYRLPVDAARAELDRIVEGHPKWDRKAKSLLVTDATERTVQLRAVVSARDAPALWDLRCEVREKLVAWLQRYEGGKYLPRSRIEADDRPGGGDSERRDRAAVSAT